MNMANFIEKNTSAEACCHFAPPITAIAAQTESKGNFHAMSL
jgi:hypothetical protein